MSTNHEPTGKWHRREQKRRPKMRVHGAGMKTLAKKLGEKDGLQKKK